MEGSFKKNILIETWVVWAITMASVVLGQVFLKKYSSLIVPLALIYIPLGLSIIKKTPVTFLETTPSRIYQSLKSLLVFSLILFPLIFLVYHLFLSGLGFKYMGYKGKTDLFTVYYIHLLTAAFPEEFFFRGYLQEKWNLLSDKGISVFGVKISFWALLCCLVFALSHSLVAYRPWHVLIFFPALCFTWLKEKTGGILAPALFHAACNTFSHWAGWSYFK